MILVRIGAPMVRIERAPVGSSPDLRPSEIVPQKANTAPEFPAIILKPAIPYGIDPSLSVGTIELRTIAGRVVGRITNLKSET